MKIVDIERPAQVPRAKNGQPRVFSPCSECETTGKVPSPKTGKPIKCQKCKGDGYKGSLYTRMTTFIDCLDDKSNLMDWKQRVVVAGFAIEPSLLEEAQAIEDPLDPEHRDALNKLVDRAEAAAEIDLKAKTGDVLHEIIENINLGKDPGFIPDEFQPDIDAYVEVLRREGIIVVGVEAFVVNDKFGWGGSFDILGLHYGQPLVQNEVGKWVGPPGVTPVLRIMDVKTGRIDYGRAKIAMQLSGYSRSKLYSPVKPYERKPITHSLEDGTTIGIDMSTGIIIHLPAGEGICEAVPVDLDAAATGLYLASRVREWRRQKFQDDPTTTVRAAELCK